MKFTFIDTNTKKTPGFRPESGRHKQFGEPNQLHNTKLI